MQDSVTRKMRDISANNIYQYMFFCDACEKPWRSVASSFTRGNIDFSVRESERLVAYSMSCAEAEKHYYQCPEGTCRICAECYSKVLEHGACEICNDEKQQGDLCDPAEASQAATGFFAAEQDGLEANVSAEPEDSAEERQYAGLLRVIAQRKKTTVLFIAAGALAFVIGFSGLYVTKLNSATEIGDMEVPLASFSAVKTPLPIDADAIPYTGGAVETYGEASQKVQAWEGSSIPVTGTAAQLLLLNPEGNACYLRFALVLAQGGESLYSSQLVEPGMCIESQVFDKELAQGVHEAELAVYVYSFDGFTLLREDRTELLLEVG